MNRAETPLPDNVVTGIERTAFFNPQIKFLLARISLEGVPRIHELCIGQGETEAPDHPTAPNWAHFAAGDTASPVASLSSSRRVRLDRIAPAGGHVEALLGNIGPVVLCFLDLRRAYLHWIAAEAGPSTKVAGAWVLASQEQALKWRCYAPHAPCRLIERACRSPGAAQPWLHA